MAKLATADHLPHGNPFSQKLARASTRHVRRWQTLAYAACALGASRVKKIESFCPTCCGSVSEFNAHLYYASFLPPEKEGLLLPFEPAKLFQGRKVEGAERNKVLLNTFVGTSQRCNAKRVLEEDKHGNLVVLKKSFDPTHDSVVDFASPSGAAAGIQAYVFISRTGKRERPGLGRAWAMAAGPVSTAGQGQLLELHPSGPLPTAADQVCPLREVSECQKWRRRVILVTDGSHRRRSQLSSVATWERGSVRRVRIFQMILFGKALVKIQRRLCRPVTQLKESVIYCPHLPARKRRGYPLRHTLQARH